MVAGSENEVISYVEASGVGDRTCITRFVSGSDTEHIVVASDSVKRTKVADVAV